MQVARGALTVAKALVLPSVDKSRSNAAVVNKYLEKHAKLRTLEPLDKLKLAASAATWALSDPYQGQGVAVLGEITAEPSLRRMRERMLESEEGRAILQNRSPALIQGASTFREGSLGKTLEKCVPEERSKVLLIEDQELAFIMRRYRDAHDILHALTGMPVSVAGEIALKWYELAATNMPMTTLAAVVGLSRVEPNSWRLLAEWIPWAASAGRQGRFYLAVDFAKYADMDVDEFRERIMGWPALPKSLREYDYLHAHYKSALHQAERESREAKALREQSEVFESLAKAVRSTQANNAAV
jgi:ubiquinone biosynthesis protein COQ4